VLRAVPNWLDQPEKLGPADAGLERGRVRSAAVVFTVGVATAVGAFFAGLTFRLSRRGQGTDRFNRAIELIGHAERNVRLGGIYALGQLAREDPRRHHRPVLEVLLAYVRDQSPWPPLTPEAPSSSAQRVGAAWRALRGYAPVATVSAPPTVPHASADVKAAMAIIARRNTDHDPKPLEIDLSNTNLRGIDVPGIHLQRALLADCQLQDAILHRAHLEGAVLANAALDWAELDDAELDANTSFEGASLAGTTFTGIKGVASANFTGATDDPGATDWGANNRPAGVTAAP
jgi:hypothetical protein